MNFYTYFSQNQNWVKLWKTLKSNPQFDYFVHTQYGCEFVIYQYPYSFGQVMWFANCLGKESDLKNLDIDKLNSILTHITTKAKDQDNVVILKLSFNPDFVEQLLAKKDKLDCQETNKPITTSQELFQHLQLTFGNRIVIPDNNLQNNSTIVLDLKAIPNDLIYSSQSNQNQVLTTDILAQFWSDSQEFWKTTSSNIRRYTKKSLTQNWTVDINKNNFDQAYDLLILKCQELGFFVHDKQFIQSILDQDNAYLVTLKDSSGAVQGCWIGFQYDDVMIYWYGANSQVSFDNYGQYLMHLTAIYLTLKNQGTDYDLGGYSPTEGFGKFKELYRGRIVSFCGDYDIVVKPNLHNLDKLSCQFKKLVSKLKG